MGADRYRKKPVEVEALRVADAIRQAGEDLFGDMPDWLRNAYAEGRILFCPDCVHIKTLEGDMRGEPGDYIIRGVKGELYPCKPDVFAATYEKV